MIEVLRKSCNRTYNLTSTLYQCVYCPQPRVQEDADKVIEKKCLQMRSVFNLMSAIGNVEKFGSGNSRHVKQLIFQLFQIIDPSKIQDEKTYQKVLTDLVEKHCDTNEVLYCLLMAQAHKKPPFGIVYYVKDCPDLFLMILYRELFNLNFL